METARNETQWLESLRFNCQVCGSQFEITTGIGMRIRPRLSCPNGCHSVLQKYLNRQMQLRYRYSPSTGTWSWIGEPTPTGVK